MNNGFKQAIINLWYHIALIFLESKIWLNVRYLRLFENCCVCSKLLSDHILWQFNFFFCFLQFNCYRQLRIAITKMAWCIRRTYHQEFEHENHKNIGGEGYLKSLNWVAVKEGILVDKIARKMAKSMVNWHHYYCWSTMPNMWRSPIAFNGSELSLVY